MKISDVITGAKVLRRKLATTEVTSRPTHLSSDSVICRINEKTPDNQTQSIRYYVRITSNTECAKTK